MKICRTCSKEKEESEFYSRTRYGRTDYNLDCKPCFLTASMARHNPVVRYRKELPKKFGITWEDYLGLHKKQAGVCAICKTSIKVNGEHVHRDESGFVDHNHTTGKVRGLLCNKCNRALGLFRDSKEVLEAATKYLNETDSGTD